MAFSCGFNSRDKISMSEITYKLFKFLYYQQMLRTKSSKFIRVELPYRRHGKFGGVISSRQVRVDLSQCHKLAFIVVPMCKMECSILFSNVFGRAHDIYSNYPLDSRA